MASINVTMLYAGLLTIIYLVLFGMAGAARGKANISLGDGGNHDLITANRRHMNFVENVPLALILIGLAEMSGASKTMIHILGIALTLARIIHPFGLDFNNMRKMPRFIGVVATTLVIAFSALYLLWRYVAG